MIKDCVASTQSWPEVQDWLLTSFNCQIGSTVKNNCKDSTLQVDSGNHVLGGITNDFSKMRQGLGGSMRLLCSGHSILL